jgi:hypothetical protein
MKKLIAVCAVLLFVAPAFAADWSFYGSERIATWYNSQDYKDMRVAGQDNDSGTQWYLQGNSRLGAKVKADKVTGQIELALGTGGDGGDTSVATRRAYGIWKFSDNGGLKIGKDYSPVTDFISNQWYAADNDLLGEGNFYGRRPAGITLILGGFELAALVPSYGADLNTTATGINGVTGSPDPDSYIPRFEASYELKLGAGYIKPFGGIQYYTVQQGNAATSVTGDIDVLSYVAGISSNWNIGAFSIGGQLSYGMNQGNVQGWDTGSNARSSSSAYLKNGDDIANVYTLQALIVPAIKVTDTLRFEAGLGYRMDNADGAPGYSQKNDLWVTYVQAMVTLAPGVYFCPEVGYYDFMDGVNGDSQGYQWYVGAKWQIDF